MARGIPDEQVYRPELSAEDLPRKHIPELRGISVGPGLEALGETLSKKYESDANTYAGNQLADLRIGMEQSMEQAKATAKPGADGYTQGVLAEFDKRAKQFTQDGGSNALLAHAMQPGLATMRKAFGAAAVAYEADAGIKYRASSAQQTADKLATVAAQHPDQASDLTAQALAQINGSNLGPDVTLATAKYAQSTIAKSAVLARINADPYRTMSDLLKPETADLTIQALRPEERETLLTHADAMLHQRVADAERLTSMTEKEERENASAALTGLIVKSQSPEGLTMGDVLKAAPLFRHEPQALEAAMNIAGGKEVRTDPHVYADLFRQASEGQNVFDAASGHLGHDLAIPDFDRVMSIGDRGLPNAVQEGIKTIDGIFKQGVFDKYDPAFNTRHMNALNDYYAWARANPNATPEQSTKQAMQISESYAMASLSSFQRTAPLPRFAVGGRVAMDPDRTEAATVAAEKAGTISHSEAVQQAGLIEQWRTALEHTTASKAAP